MPIAAQNLMGKSQQDVFDIVPDFAKGQITEEAAALRSSGLDIQLVELKDRLSKRLASTLNQMGIELMHVNLTDNSIFK